MSDGWMRWAHLKGILNRDLSTIEDVVERDFLVFEQQTIRTIVGLDDAWPELVAERSGIKWEYRNGETSFRRYHRDLEDCQKRIDANSTSRKEWLDELTTRREELRRYKSAVSEIGQEN